MTPRPLVRFGTLLMADEYGNIDSTTDRANGLYVADTRLLSTWRLDIGALLDVAATDSAVGERGTVLLPRGQRNRPEPLLLQRQQLLDAHGLFETIRIQNLSDHTMTVTISLVVATDFADQFMVRSDGRIFDLSPAQQSATVEDGTLVLRYKRQHGTAIFEASCRVAGTPVPDISQTGETHVLRWLLNVAGLSHQTITVRADDNTVRKVDVGLTKVPRESKSPQMPSDMLLQKSLADVDSLMMPAPGRRDLSIPAAGAPWFLTLFGRDSLLTAELIRPYRPDVAPAVLRALAASQGTKHDPRTLEEPGRIIHESRVGELASLDVIPYGRYYGSIDATPLFLAILGRTLLGQHAHSDAAELAQELRGAAMAALAWIRGPGGLDEHGFLCSTPDPGGLINQGWKDSADSTVTADGRILTGRTALCEVQGYCWDAFTQLAGIARTFWRDEALADQLDDLASQLQTRFLDKFWLPDKEYPAMALVYPTGSSEQQAADALTSNAGHLLWSGMLPLDHATAVAERITDSSFFSGWGIRTLADGQRPYSPLSYHNGSVWPHDSMLIANGLQRYGLHTAAHRVAAGIVSAGRALDNTLPELIAGFSSNQFPRPIRYRFAGDPQAWSAAAAVAAVCMLDEVSETCP